MVQTPPPSSIGANIEDGGDKLFEIMQKQKKEFENFVKLQKDAEEKLAEMFEAVKDFLAADVPTGGVRQGSGQSSGQSGTRASQPGQIIIKYKCSQHKVQYEVELQDGLLDCPRCKKNFQTQKNLEKHLQSNLKSCKCLCPT